MTKKNLMPAIVLSAICVAAALLLSVINIFTGPKIAENNEKKATEALVKVFPGGTGFEKLDLANYELPESITAAYREASGGFVIQATVSGWKSGLVIMCGIDKDGKIVGADYTASQETLGAEIGLGNRFVGKTKDQMTPDIVAGPTAKMTTGAYYNAIKDAFEAYNVLKGGKTLAQSLNAALGLEGAEFDKWLAVTTLEGIDAVYTAKNNGGRVYVIGESFIGITSDGTVVATEASVEDQAKAVAANDVLKAITYEDVTGFENENVVSVKKANNGAYVFELNGNGYDVSFEYSKGNEPGNTPQPIVIMLSISEEGKIIDVMTVLHRESKGYGDECATEEYYEQYKGKEDTDIKVSTTNTPTYNSDYVTKDSTDVGAISSATYTTVGYQQAIKAAFEVFNSLTSTEGGND